MAKASAPQGRREGVMTFLIVIGVIVVVALVFGYRYDRKHRSRGDSSSGGVTGHKARQTKLDGREKGSRWGAGL
jgi:FtsZ-interacting cell division protein ZipA